MFLKVLQYICCFLVAAALAKRNSPAFIVISVLQLESGLLSYGRFVPLKTKTLISESKLLRAYIFIHYSSAHL